MIQEQLTFSSLRQGNNHCLILLSILSWNDLIIPFVLMQPFSDH